MLQNQLLHKLSIFFFFHYNVLPHGHTATYTSRARQHYIHTHNAIRKIF